MGREDLKGYLAKDFRFPREDRVECEALVTVIVVLDKCDGTAFQAKCVIRRDPST
jgi:hypothetical protein